MGNSLLFLSFEKKYNCLICVGLKEVKYLYKYKMGVSIFELNEVNSPFINL